MIYRIIILSVILVQFAMAENKVFVSNFAMQSLENWQEKVFMEKTAYRFVKSGTTYVLEASSHKSASGLFQSVNIDLNKTPYINWSWRVMNSLNGLNEQAKTGDDYAARIYLVKKNSFFFWKTQAINYVWSSKKRSDTIWNNAFTSQAKMFAVRGNESLVSHWYHEKRNVLADFKRAFDEVIVEINVVAIMTDTDNSKLSAQAEYGEIFFSSE